MRLRKLIASGLLLFSLVSLSGCHEKEKYSGKTEVVYELEGGVYQNCTAAVRYYYDLTEETLLVEPSKVTGNNVTRTGYEFMGWYKDKIVNGSEVTYENKWNFETDYLPEGGITLYACWKKVFKYTFNVCYYDDNGNIVVLGDYSVDAGDKFSDRRNIAKRRIGYTVLEYVDENGNAIDDSFTHPGGEKDLAVNVFVNYIEGNYSVVRTAAGLKSSLNQNIYLANDIDLNGESINFENYRFKFLGNGHTISNFTVKYSADRRSLIDDFTDDTKKSLCISLFGNTKKAYVENVTFKDVKIVVNTTLSITYKIYVAPLSVSATESEFKNVSFSGSYKCEMLPNNFDKDMNLVYITDQGYYLKDETSKFTDVNLDIVILENE